MSDTVHVKGLADIQKLLDTLPVKIERNAMRGALRAGATAIKPVAQANIRSQSGELAASLKVSTRARGGVVTASLGTKVFYAKFVEFGTPPHRIAARKGRGLSVGPMVYRAVDHPGSQPRPFLRPAMDTQAQAAVIAAGQYLKGRLSSKEGLDTSHIEIEGDE